jgi:hypothetical protein
MQTAERDAQQEGASAMPATDDATKQLTIKLPISASLFETLDQEALEGELGKLAWQAGMDLIDAGSDEPEAFVEVTCRINRNYLTSTSDPEAARASFGEMVYAAALRKCPADGTWVEWARDQ